MALAPFLWSFCPLRAGLAEERAPGALAESRAVRQRASAASSKRVFLIFPPKVWLMFEAGRREPFSRREGFDARKIRGACARATHGETGRTRAHLEIRGKARGCGQESGK